VIRHYIATAITVVVQLSRLKGGRRRVMRVSELLGTEPAPYAIQDLFGFRQTGVRDRQAVGEFYATGVVPRCLERIRTAGIELPDALFSQRILSGSPPPEKSA
jgi:pilus assembly protein CpaF